MAAPMHTTAHTARITSGRADAGTAFRARIGLPAQLSRRSPGKSAMTRSVVRMSAASSQLVKICGVAHVDDALHAAKAGANFVGMIMTPGYARSVDISQAAEIAAAAKEGGALPVGVFVKENAEQMGEAWETAGLGLVQLHGDGSRDCLKDLALKIPAIWVVSADGEGVIQGYLPGQKEDEDKIAAAAERGGMPSDSNPMKAAYNFMAGGRRTVDYVLVDGLKVGPMARKEYCGGRRTVDYVLVDGLKPGSGETFDWRKLKAPRGCSRKGWGLAGGLDPDNVATAVSITHPTLVDTSSGVCGPDGVRKDHARIDDFVAAARGL